MISASALFLGWVIAALCGARQANIAHQKSHQAGVAFTEPDFDPDTWDNARRSALATGTSAAFMFILAGSLAHAWLDKLMPQIGG